VVVDEVADLDVGAVGEEPVSDVGLPAFVGLGRFEADVAALGPFVRFGNDEAPLGQDPPDRRQCRGLPVASLQVRCDRGRTGLVAVAVELFADLDDFVRDVIAGACR
jgi:hypothetical protein